MRTILRKTSTKQLAGYALLTALVLLFMGSFITSENSLHAIVTVLVSFAWAILSMVGFACLLHKGFTWAMGE